MLGNVAVGLPVMLFALGLRGVLMVGIYPFMSGSH